MKHAVQSIYYNGDILTMEGEAPSYVEAILVENGKIKRTGFEADIFEEAIDNAEKVNLRGNTLMPSFIDLNGHIFMIALHSSLINLSRCNSSEEIITTMKQFEKSHPVEVGQWLEGLCYDFSNSWEEHHLTREVLDCVSTTCPIYVSRVAGKIGWINTKALEVMGLTKESKNPDGGILGRESNGDFNGYLQGTALDFVEDKIKSAPIIKDYLHSLEEAQDYYIQNGITTVQTKAPTIKMCKMLNQLASINPLKVDVIVCPNLFINKEEDELTSLKNSVGRSPNILAGIRGGTDPLKDLEVYNVLKKFTQSAAHECLEADRKGTIKEGKHANLVVLSRNPMKVPREAIRNIEVLQTIKDGVCLYHKVKKTIVRTFK